MGISIDNQDAEEGTNVTMSLGRKRTSDVHERVRDKAAEQVISFKDVPDETIIPQFWKLLERFVVKNKEESDLDSKELIKLFLKKERVEQRNRDSCTLHL